MAEIVRCGEFVGRGEELTASHLERNLPPSWVVICNKELVSPSGAVSEIDFIIIGDHVVFVADEKSWSGPIHGDENGWVLRSGESYRSPISACEGCARRLAGILRDNVPRLEGTIGNRHFVFARVILSAEKVDTFIHDPRATEQVLQLEGCEEDLTRFDRHRGEECSVAGFRDNIRQCLTGLSDRPNTPRTINAYHVVEVLPNQGPIRRYRVQHADHTERLLKLVPCPSNADPVRRDNWENALLREYTTLQKLKDTGRVPGVDRYFMWDQDQFWAVPIHPLEGASLRSDRTKASPDERRIWKVMGDAFEALFTVHESGVVHRGLSPETVGLDGDDRVVFSDFIFARIDDAETIAAQADDLVEDNPYLAPECKVGLAFAEQASDVYSLARSLHYWISGDEESEELCPRMVERTDLSHELSDLLVSIFQDCLKEDERFRPSAREIADRISRSVKTREASEQSHAEGFSPGDLVASQYKVIRELGKGATAKTFLVEDSVTDSLCVLKKILNPELCRRLARDEFRFLRDLNHPNLPRVYDVRPPASEFHLKLEYVPGSPLREVMEDHVGDLQYCLHVAKALLSSLSYLEERNGIHRDISPNNILIPDEGVGEVKLIDFGLATVEQDTTTAVGTPRYRAPEIDAGGKWTAACDIYSAGVVLYELLTGRLPYAVQDGVPRKLVQMPFPSELETRYGSRLFDVLRRAVCPTPEERYQSANEFADALERSVGGDVEDTSYGTDVHNRFVSELRSAYRNSEAGNSSNRGLDSEFSQATYVKTELDTELTPLLLEGACQLVILSGNPGDGKTAYLQQLLTELQQSGAEVEANDPSGWSCHIGNRDIRALYDASESSGQMSSDDLMHGILQPLAGDVPLSDGYTAIVAANDGRLLDYFDRYGTQRYPVIWPKLEAQLLGGGDTGDGVLLVDLKRRSLASLKAEDPSVFSSILDEFTKPERWQVCSDCSARNECPILWNVRALQDNKRGPRIRERLRSMLLAVHFRRERRPTIRDLRSALAFLITHDTDCSVVHEERDMGQNPLAGMDRAYFTAAFDGSGRPDVLLDGWRILDPAAVGSPRLDRFLYFHRQPGQTQQIDALFGNGSAGNLAPQPLGDDGVRGWMDSLKRRYYFEGDEERGDSSCADLPAPGVLFPYRYFDDFVQALEVCRNGNSSAIQLRILRGIAKADGVPDVACDDSLALCLNDEGAEDITVIVKYPRDHFHLLVPTQNTAIQVGFADTLTLQYGRGRPQLELSLDLFEFLCRAEDGYTTGADEQRPLVEDLATFKSQLLTQQTHEVFIVEAGVTMHHIISGDGQIKRVKEDGRL